MTDLLPAPQPDAQPDPVPAPTPDTPSDDSPFRASRRIDGWSGERQAAFLEHVADGHSVEIACRMVGLSVASAYAFRRRAAGQAFALGWRAARLVARDKVADDLMDRAFQGQTVTVTRDDGTEVTRHHYDNRLGLALLTRLDRQAEAESGADGHAVRLVAGEFDAYVEMIQRGDAGPARAGLFLARRLPGEGGAGDARDLGPVLALAAADRFARTGAAVASDVAIADLDPAARAGWSAEQWARAEAAGLVAIAAPAPAAIDPQLPQHSPAADTAPDDAPRVWWDDERYGWMTDFPPAEDFAGYEEGEYGDEGYERELSEDEDALAEAPHAAMVARLRKTEGELRDAHFAALAADVMELAHDPDLALALAPPAAERH